MFTLRHATPADIPALQSLIDTSVRTLSAPYNSPAQIASALRYIFGVDTQLLADQTYYVLESVTGELVAAGGWSQRQTLYGGDQMKAHTDPLLDPRTDAARIRAFYVHPDYARRGLARRLFTHCATAAQQAGFRALELMATLPGEPLYQALGFTPLERTEALLPDGVALPLVRMRLELD